MEYHIHVYQPNHDQDTLHLLPDSTKIPVLCSKDGNTIPLILIRYSIEVM